MTLTKSFYFSKIPASEYWVLFSDPRTIFMKSWMTIQEKNASQDLIKPSSRVSKIGAMKFLMKRSITSHGKEKSYHRRQRLINLCHHDCCSIKVMNVLRSQKLQRMCLEKVFMAATQCGSQPNSCLRGVCRDFKKFLTVFYKHCIFTFTYF